MNNIFYGEVWFVNLDPTLGHEQAKLRPCLVISNDIFNNGPAELVTILPITSKFRTLSWLVEITLPKKLSYVICNQPRTVSKKRFKNRIAHEIPPLAMDAIRKRLRILLNF